MCLIATFVLDRSLCARAQWQGDNFTSFAPFSTLSTMVWMQGPATPKDTKTTQMLDINNAKRLTNIS
jgi:hypothetical protein